MRKYLAILSVLLLPALLCACKTAVVPTEQPTTEAPLPTDAPVIPEQQLPEIPGFSAQEGYEAVSQNGLEILAVGSYSGAFFEDGSDDAVEKVAALVVKNTGTETVEYGEIDAGASHFVFSALPVNAVMLVLESNRGTAAELSDAQVTARVAAAEVREDYTDSFEIYLGDGVINIRNIAGKSFSDDVSVYYKNVCNGILLGGITYRARFAGVADGAIAQSIQSHATADSSAVVYMTYDR